MSYRVPVTRPLTIGGCQSMHAPTYIHSTPCALYTCFKQSQIHSMMPTYSSPYHVNGRPCGEEL